MNKKLVGAALIVAAIAFTGAASTASNTVAAGAGRLGFSDTVVSGGTINSINYDLDSAHPPLLTAVHIEVEDMTPDAVVKVQLNAGGNIDTCAKGAAGVSPTAHVYDCTLTGANAALSADLLLNTYITIT
jgi:hypothetical protein